MYPNLQVLLFKLIYVVHFCSVLCCVMLKYITLRYMYMLHCTTLICQVYSNKQLSDKSCRLHCRGTYTYRHTAPPCCQTAACPNHRLLQALMMRTSSDSVSLKGMQAWIQAAHPLDRPPALLLVPHHQQEQTTAQAHCLDPAPAWSL